MTKYLDELFIFPYRMNFKVHRKVGSTLNFGNDFGWWNFCLKQLTTVTSMRWSKSCSQNSSIFQVYFAKFSNNVYQTWLEISLNSSSKQSDLKIMRDWEKKRNIERDRVRDLDKVKACVFMFHVQNQKYFI